MAGENEGAVCTVPATGFSVPKRGVDGCEVCGIPRRGSKADVYNAVVPPDEGYGIKQGYAFSPGRR